MFFEVLEPNGPRAGKMRNWISEGAELDFRGCGFGDFDEIRGCLETVIFNLSFEAVQTWRPPSGVTDDTDDITREPRHGD